MAAFFLLREEYDKCRYDKLAEIFYRPPTAQLNWGYKPNNNAIHQVIVELKKAGMMADDLLMTFVSRRVSPLQRRVHKIYHMSGPLDPTRMSTIELDKAQIQRRVKSIARTRMEPYSRNNIPPSVSNLNFYPT